ncbi:hypothetical protein ACTID9_25615 [Brevibacillus fluminis]|uniref:hypothetical protein n=1 Tax=Brevibacillus fluminis TaxID=511487 RepID=UPI003F892247
MSQACKIKFRQDTLRVRSILCDHDPLGLIRSGAPADEYDRHAAKTLIILHKIKNGQQTSADLHAYLKALGDHAEIDALCAELLAVAKGLDDESPPTPHSSQS